MFFNPTVLQPKPAPNKLLGYAVIILSHLGATGATLFSFPDILISSSIEGSRVVFFLRIAFAGAPMSI